MTDESKKMADFRKDMNSEEEIDLPEDLRNSAEQGDPASEIPDDYMPPPPPPEDGGDHASDEPPNPIALAAQEPLNDIGNANRFIIHFGQDIQHVAQVGWHIWDGRRWRKDLEISKGLSPRHPPADATDVRADCAGDRFHSTQQA